ncbi:MAG: hypothetical protein AB7L90_05800 [Hyphomicrobiaceae bacterium]
MRPGRAIAGVALGLGLIGPWFGGVGLGVAVARVQQAPASRVAIDLPEGYRPARLFSGFVNPSAGVSIVILEMPSAAYEQLASGLTPEALAAKGITNIAAGKLPRAEPYIFMSGEQMSAQGPVAKFFVAFRNKHVTALITANVQKTSLDAGTTRVADVEHMLASATIAAAEAPARDVFQLGYLGPFRTAGKILGTSRAYTLDGKFEPAKAGAKRPLLLVAPSLDLRPVDDPDAQAEALFAGLPGLKDTKIVDRRRIMIAGLPAVEMAGTATDTDEGDVSLYQILVLPPTGGYYRLLGQVPAEQAPALMPELEKIARSFRIVE